MALICHQERKSEQSLRDLTLPQNMLSPVRSLERPRILKDKHCCGPSSTIFTELPNPLALSLCGTYQQRELVNCFPRLPGIALLGSSLLRPVYVSWEPQNTSQPLLLPSELQSGRGPHVPTSVLWSPHPSQARGHSPSVLQGLALLPSLPQSLSFQTIRSH